MGCRPYFPGSPQLQNSLYHHWAVQGLCSFLSLLDYHLRKSLDTETTDSIHYNLLELQNEEEITVWFTAHFGKYTGQRFPIEALTFFF